MNLRWTSVAWSVVYLLLLLSFATPFSFITIFVLLLPGVILYATLSVRAFALHIAIVWIAAALLLSNPVIILLAVFFMVPALVMGHFYKTRASALKVVVMGTGTLLLEFLLAFLAVTVIYDFSLASSIEETLNTMMSLMQNMADNELIASDLVWSPEMAQQLSSLAARMTPFTMIMCSFLLAAVTHLIARPTLNSLGHSVRSFPPLRDWRLPRALIWYYLATVLIMLFGSAAVMDSFVGTVLLNLSPLLNFLFMIQAASFFFFLAYQKKWNPAIPVLLIIAMLFIPPLKIVGILDIAMPLREMITRSRR
ncbi:DUF2232 domain-containing protein [Paenibacillus woosongensis]|uniref:DUF2232 domain-containing protein n=1 Tax=Paenibacillus woosongensis TaxID=307580 RepID=A0A7X3CQH3_9BACL|nr:DUF2232 domain-containing protein [Paenibacillus woosongensis]MUG47909.1 DUF2232 domain-containing protein [Paenibacillus woosongensis]